MVDWKKFCGSCKRQGHCCGTEVIYVTKAEEKRIAKATGARNFTKNGVLLKRRGKCVFQYGKLCGIHDVRPLDCRAYPIVFWSEAGNGGVSFFLDLDCAKAMKLTEKDIQKIKRGAQSELKKWTKNELFRYDVGTDWKPEELRKRQGKSFPIRD